MTATAGLQTFTSNSLQHVVNSVFTAQSPFTSFITELNCWYVEGKFQPIKGLIDLSETTDHEMQLTRTAL